MKIEMRVEYTIEEVKQLVLTHHINQFGPARTGMNWVIEKPTYLQDFSVEAVEIEKEVLVAPAMPTTRITTATETVDTKDVF